MLATNALASHCPEGDNDQEMSATTNLSLALLNANHLWSPDGASLPVDQPYSYDGPNGVGGCEAGFLVHSASTSWPVVSAGLSHRVRWRVLATSPDGTKVLVCSDYAPHVGMCLPERLAFWNHLRASVEPLLQLSPGAQLLLAGDANVYLSKVMDAGRERNCEAQLRVVIRAFLCDLGSGKFQPCG